VGVGVVQSQCIRHGRRLSGALRGMICFIRVDFFEVRDPSLFPQLTGWQEILNELNEFLLDELESASNDVTDRLLTLTTQMSLAIVAAALEFEKWFCVTRWCLSDLGYVAMCLAPRS
jgi:hypothetical protein